MTPLAPLATPVGPPGYACHARCVFSRLRCNGQGLLLSFYFSRIGRIDNPSCSACGHSSQDTSRLILHCPATDSLSRSLFATFCLSTTSGSGPRVLPGFLGSMVFRHTPIPRKGSGNNNNNRWSFRFLCCITALSCSVHPVQIVLHDL